MCVAGRALPVASHGRELCAHHQPRVRRAAHQGVHQDDGAGDQEEGVAVLPGRIVRPRRTDRSLPARSAPV